MLLHDFSRKDKQRILQINRFLKENFGFSLSLKNNKETLQETKIAAEKNIQHLKNRNMTPKDKELAKQLLIQEGAEILLRSSKQKLDEYALSNPYLRVMDWLTEFVVNSVEVGDSEEEAIASAMKEYRSSKYRFPDFEVEYDLKNRVAEQLPTVEDAYAVDDEEQLDEVGGAQVGKVRHGDAWDLDPGAEKSKAADRLLKRMGSKAGGLSLEPMSDEPKQDQGKTTFVDPKKVRKPMGKASFDVPTQGKEKKWESVKGNNMNRVKEGHVKHLRHLLEAEVEQAEVLIAAKGFAQEIQDMIEKLGRLMNEDLAAVSDQMRQAYGADVAAEFQGSMTAQFQQTIGTLKGTKESIDSAVSGLADGGNDMMAEPDMGMEPELGDELGGDEFGDELGGDELGGDELGGDELGGEGDVFGGDELDADEPLGRGQKESFNDLRNRIVEMQTRLAKVKQRK